MPPKTSKPQTCKFFRLPGGCKRGSSCKFAHDASGSPSTSRLTNAKKPPPRAPNGICDWFYATGKCARGFECRYKHERGPAASSATAQSTSQPGPESLTPFLSESGIARLGLGGASLDAPAMSPSEVHTYLRRYQADTFRFQSTRLIYNFMRMLSSARSDNQSWDIEDGQLFLSSIVSGNLLNRINNILQWPSVSPCAGNNETTLSFQRGVLPLLQFFSCDFVVKSTLTHRTNALYVLIMENAEHIAAMISSSMQQMLAAKSFKDPNSPGKGPGGSEIFMPLSTVLFECLTRFKHAVVSYPCLASLAENLQIWTDSWCDGVLSSSFNDAIKDASPLVRDHILQHIKSNVSRIVSIVDRELRHTNARSEKMLTRHVTVPRNEGLVAMLQSTFEGPGELRGQGPRHDNDYLRIEDVRIAPTHEELSCLTPPFLPGNFFEAPHHLDAESMERLLDTQFRLLREELTAPLRSSSQLVVNDLKSLTKKGNRLSELIQRKGGKYHGFADTQESVMFNVYTNVRFTSLQTENRGLCASLTLDAPPGRARSASAPARASFWDAAGGKRLMTGGLVALVWARGLNVGVYLGTIASSIQDLKESAKKEPDRIGLRIAFFDSQVERDILEELKPSRSRLTQFGTLIEAPVMYEAIRPFLEALKVVPETIPFSRYLPPHPSGYLSSITVDLPKYALSPGFSYQLASLFPKTSNIRDLRMSAQDPHSVERARRQLKEGSRLDYSQADAVVDTLIREVSLIQGPPGTGKSYTGVELIRVLLANRLGPILMIAFTNHALDHLLLSVLDSDITRSIVRLGSRSADDRISQYSIENLEMAANQTGLRRSLGPLHRELKEVEADFEKLMAKFKRKNVDTAEILKYIDMEYSEHYDGYLCPPSWVKTVKKYFASSDEGSNSWQRVDKRGRAEAEDDSLYTFWRTAKDLDFLATELSRPPPIPSEPEPEAVSQVRNQFDALSIDPIDTQERDSDSSSSADADEDEDEDEDAKELWQRVSWEKQTPPNSRVISPPAAPATSPTNPTPLSQSQTPLTSSSSAPVPRTDLANFEDLPGFFRAHGVETVPCIPTSNRPLESLLNAPNIWNYSATERQRLHTMWMENVRANAHTIHLDEFDRLRRKHEAAQKKFLEGKNEMRRALLKGIDVIGCTTTGAAKLTALLKSVAPRIMLVEEAGQVLEAHILGSLVPSVEHLILIGDPKQLRPTLNNYSLSMDSRTGRELYRLDMSLMERLSEGGLPMSVINKQRRMRPTISSLIRNTLYPTLEDSETVKQYPDVKGLAKNVFFLDHNHRECGGTEESSSKYNDYEVKMIKDLVLYLLRQGPYSDEGDIVVLCAYLGQLARVRDALINEVAVIIDERDQMALADQEGEKSEDEAVYEVATRVSVPKRVKIRTIDNFQGEEGKIVILSLVRNSGAVDDGMGRAATIGFLRSDNRSNVALSRAREGMFILGNSSQLSARSKMWRSVVAELNELDSLGPAFPVCCSQHPDSVQQISEPGQLPRFAPDGGCLLSCSARLRCGHLCPHRCHPDDKNHITVQCHQRCTKLCPRQHPCTKACAKECGKCQFTVSHVKLPCGHIASSVRCFELDALEDVYCNVKVIKELPRCEHPAKMACSADPAKYTCQSRCSVVMPCCGRECTSQCHSCMQLSGGALSGGVSRVTRTIHKSHPCKAPLYCNHQCQSPCSADHQHTTFCKEACRQECKHARCILACSAPCAPCQEPCTWSCPHAICPLPCGSVCARLPCDRRCEKMLECGHKCPSVCGEECSIQICPLCAGDNKRAQVVDVIMGKTLGEVDTEQGTLDELIITLPKCGHVFTVETLDGICEMDEVYHRETTGEDPGPWLKLKSPPLGFKNPPVCPTCRSAITSPRYGRVFKRADLDILERNVASQMSSMLNQIRKSIGTQSKTTLQEQLGRAAGALKVTELDSPKKAKKNRQARKSALREDRIAPMTPTALDPSSDCHDISSSVSAAWTKTVRPILETYSRAFKLAHTRSAHIHAWEAAISFLYQQEMDIIALEGPSKAPRNPQEHAMRLARLKVGQTQPLADKKYLVETFLVTLELRFTLVELGSIMLKEAGPGFPASEKQQWAAYCLFILDSCLSDATIAYNIAENSKARRQMTRMSLLNMRAELERFRFNVDAAKESGILKDAREHYIERSVEGLRKAERSLLKTVHGHRAAISADAEKTWVHENFTQIAAVIIEEWKSLERSLSRDTFYEPVSLQEKMDVVKAFAGEFHHTGHFYNCPNGHPFVIGECGGAMERAVCPECGSAVGGANHTLELTNTRATDLENLAREGGAQRSPWAWGN